VSSPSGGRQGMRGQAIVSCQICLVKEHSIIKWWIVSAAWSHRGHWGGCCSPRRARQSAVQHLSRLASHWKNLTRGGAQLLQVSFQAAQVIAP
jgi:hypothetical protein